TPPPVQPVAPVVQPAIPPVPEVPDIPPLTQPPSLPPIETPIETPVVQVPVQVPVPVLPQPAPLPVPTPGKPVAPPNLPLLPPPDVAANGKFLVLKGDKLVEGSVSVIGEKAIIRQGSLEREVPRTDVLFVAQTRDDVYRFMLAKVSGTDP